MENAVDALKIAFAVFVFTMALSLAMYMFSEAKATGDIVLARSDVTGYMDYTELEDIQEGVTVIGTDRVVGLETIIPTLYKYYKENYTVIFRDVNGQPLELYTTQTEPRLWSPGYINKYYTNDQDLKICSFDVDEESRRREPWTGGSTNINTNYYKLNLDMFLSGGTFTAPSGNGMDYNYSDININGWGSKEGFADKYKDARFRESLGQYTYSEQTTQEQQTEGLPETKQKTKRVIIYTLLPN